MSKMGNLDNSIFEPGNEDAIFIPAENIDGPNKIDAIIGLEAKRKKIILEMKSVADSEERSDLAAIDLLMVEIEKHHGLDTLLQKLRSEIKSLDGVLGEFEKMGAKSYTGDFFQMKSERMAQKIILERRLALLEEAIAAQA